MDKTTVLATGAGIATIITKEDALFIITLVITFLNFLKDYLKGRKEKQKAKEQ